MTTQRSGNLAFTNAIALGPERALRTTGIPVNAKMNEQESLEPVYGSGTEFSRNVKGMIGNTEFLAAARLKVVLQGLGPTTTPPPGDGTVGSGRVWAKFNDEVVQMPPKEETPAQEDAPADPKGKQKEVVPGQEQSQDQSRDESDSKPEAKPTPTKVYPVISVPDSGTTTAPGRARPGENIRSP